MKVLIIFHGLLPDPSAPTIGASIRVNMIAHALKERGHEIILASAHDSLEQFHITPKEAVQKSPFDLYFFSNSEELIALTSTVSPDAIIIELWEALDMLGSHCDIPIAIDLFAPRPIEDHFTSSNALMKLLLYLELLKKGDFFFCAGERERYFYLGWLLLAGINMQKGDLAVVPTSFSPNISAPNRTFSAGDAPCFVSAGYSWPWQQITGPFNTLIKALDEAGKGSLDLYTGNFILAKEKQNASPVLPQSQRLRQNGVVSLGELESAFDSAHVAFDLFIPSIEREIAVSFRTLHYLSRGLPVIIEKEREIAPLIEKFNAGYTLSARDDSAIYNLVKDIAQNPQQLEEKSKNALRLIQAHFNWEKAIDPLDEFVCKPRKRKAEMPSAGEMFVETLRSSKKEKENLYWEKEFWKNKVETLENKIITNESKADWEKAAIIAEKDREITGTREKYETQTADLKEKYETRIAEKLGEIKLLNETLSQKDRYIDDLRARIDKHISEITALEHRLANMEVSNEKELSKIREELREKTAYLEMILSSRPYKLFKLIKG